MRALAFIAAGLAAAISACSSINVVGKTPDKREVSEIIVAELHCRETADPATGKTIACDPALQPERVNLESLDCKALPLRSAVAEQAHARCDFVGEVTRVNGVREALAPTSGEFSLVNLTPGAYRPLNEWRLSGKLD